MPWSISILLLQKVKSWILVILLYLNDDHTFVLYLRCPLTSIWRRRRFSAHTSPSITHHSGMILLTQQVFKFSHNSEFTIIPFWFRHVQHSPSAPRKSRADSPLIQVWSQILFTNSPFIFLIIILQLADHALSELSDQPNIAIPSSSSQPSIPTSSNLEEIRLKQVSVFSLADFTIPLFPSVILIPSSF